ncbi:MAG: CRISPR-associated protein Cas5 [Cyclobacteriaceae bacterium]
MPDMPMIIIDLEGPMAHFRKFFANNTAMSYTLPPRTTIMGMLAALTGRERDSYYEDFGSGKLRIAVGIRTRLKKSFHRLNYLKIESTGDFRGANGRIQVPVEVVTGHHPGRDKVAYRLYLAPGSKGNSLPEIEKALLQSGNSYALSFGTANFQASLKSWKKVAEADIHKAEAGTEPVLVHTALPADRVKRVHFSKDDHSAYRQIEEELMPADFMPDGTREVTNMNRLLFATDPDGLQVDLEGSYYRVHDGEAEQHITFME